MDKVSSLPVGILKGLVTAFATRLPRDCKNIDILTFHMRKLRSSNLGGVLIPSAIFTIVDENEDVNEKISNKDLSKVVTSKSRDQGSDTN